MSEPITPAGTAARERFMAQRIACSDWDAIANAAIDASAIGSARNALVAELEVLRTVNEWLSPAVGKLQAENRTLAVGLLNARRAADTLAARLAECLAECASLRDALYMEPK